MPADGGTGFGQEDAEALVGQVEAGLHPGDPAAYDEHRAQRKGLGGARGQRRG